MATVAVQAVSAGWLGVPWTLWAGLISAVVATGVAAFTIRVSGKNTLLAMPARDWHWVLRI